VRKSDVDKVQILVIPKHLDEEEERKKKLVFNDEKHRLWQFCYTHWKKRHDFVLISRWKSFVKDKILEVGDFHCFERSKACNIFVVVTRNESILRTR